jgi:hypothetical protein
MWAKFEIVKREITVNNQIISEETKFLQVDSARMAFFISSQSLGEIGHST